MLVKTEYIWKWIEKSKDEEDVFDKFVYGFFALNALYSSFYDRDERRAIKDLFDFCFDYERNAFIRIFDMPEYAFFIRRGPIRNMKYDPMKGIGQKDTSWDTECLPQKVPRKSNKAMLMILYQVRCNLFHGNKAFGNSNDQEIMANAAELLLQYNLIFYKCVNRL